MNSNNKIQYNELAKAKIQDNRNAVISECSKGGFTLAQQIEIKETNGFMTNVFMRNAIHIDGKEGLLNLRDAINVALKVLEEK